MFIALEGGDGSGKTSLIKVLSYYLASLGIPAITTREPGGTPMAEKMRSMVLTNAVCPLAELYLFAAARAEHCTDVVIPALLRGDWVLCDRFSGSTYVYQQCEKGLSKDLVESLDLGVQNLFAAEGLKHVLGVTDLEIVLDVGFDVAQERLNYRLGSPEGLNRLDTLDRTRFETRRNYYKDYAERTPNAVLVDGSGTPNETFAKASDLIDRALHRTTSKDWSSQKTLNSSPYTTQV